MNSSKEHKPLLENYKDQSLGSDMVTTLNLNQKLIDQPVIIDYEGGAADEEPPVETKSTHTFKLEDGTKLEVISKTFMKFISVKKFSVIPKEED